MDIQHLDDKIGGLALTLKREWERAQTPVIVLAACPPGSPHREAAVAISTEQVRQIRASLRELVAWIDREFPSKAKF